MEIYRFAAFSGLLLLNAPSWGFTQGGQYTELGSRLTQLNAGTPQPSPVEECLAMGWEWNYATSTCEPPANCPIVIATGRGAAYQLTSANDGVWFDIDGDGVLDRLAWTRPGTEVAFLALDRDGDGQLTSGLELFGSHTFPGITNGFDALAKAARDSNEGVVGGSVSLEDPLFTRLLLWTDSNHDGISQPSELRPVTEVFSAIGLGYQVHNRRDGHGNRFVYRGWATMRTAPGVNRPQDPEEGRGRQRFIYGVVLSTAR